MDELYSPDRVTKPLDLEKYFQEYQTECSINTAPSENALENRLETLYRDFNLPLSLDDVRELEGLCTIDKLKVLGENAKLPLDNIPKHNRIPEVHPITDESKNLGTVKSKEEFNHMTDVLPAELKSIKKSVDKWNNDQNDVKNIPPGSNFILKVQIFVPFIILWNKPSFENVKVEYEVEVLGTNTLPELADFIKCVSDISAIKEVPDMHYDMTNLPSAKEEYPSRCFFIEDTFYNDMSHPNSIDYSEVVRKWAAEKKIGDYKSVSMEGVTFASLKPRLGYGYVYIHQGNCEHIVSFTDARLVQSSDCLDFDKYPRTVFMKRHINSHCFICKKQYSSWMVANSDRLPVSKAFLCTRCCESYMFLDGKKIGEFELYPYSILVDMTNQEDGADRDEEED